MRDNPNERRKPRISLAVLDFEMRNRLQTVLRSASYDVVTCRQSDDLSQLSAGTDELRSYDLLIWDVEMVDEDSVRRIEDSQALAKCPPLILITAFSDQQALNRVSGLKTVADFDMPLDSYHQLATVLRLVPL